MAGIEAYVDLIPEFAALAGRIQKGVDQSVKKVKAEIPFGADFGSMTKDVAKEADTAASKAASEVDFSPAFGSMTKDVAKEADTAAAKAASDVKFGAEASFGSVVKDASSAASKAAADVSFSADTGGLAGDVRSAAKKAERSASVEIPVEVDDSGARSKLGQLGDKGKEVGGAFGEEFSGQAMEGIGAGKLAGKAGWIGLAVTAAGIFANGFTGALDQANAGRKTQAALGLSPAEAKKYSKTASDIYKDNWGESVEEVNSAIAEVRGGIKGLSKQKDLKKATEEALAYSEVFDVDVGPAATSAGTLIKNGLAKDSTEAFDLMTKSAQTAGPQMTEPILDATNEYSKHFAGLGFDGQQAMGILTTAASGGEIAIDKAGDAIKEFQIRATDLGDTGAQKALKDLGLDGEEMANKLLKGGKSAQDATGQIADGLLKIKDPAKQAQAVTALFGTQAEDIGKDNMPGFLKALSDGDKSMDDFAGSTKKAGDTISSGPTATIETFKRSVKQNLVDFIGGSVLPALGQFTGFLKTKVPAAWHGLTDTISKNEDFQSIGASLGSIGQSLQTFFGHVGAAARQLWTVIGPTVKKLFDNLKNTVGGILSGMLKGLSGTLELIAGLLSGDPKKIKEGGKKVFQGLAKIVGSILRGILGTANAIFGDTARAGIKKFGELKDGAVNKAKTMGAGVDKFIGKMKTGAINTATGMRDGVVKRATGLKDSVTSQFTKTRDNALSRLGKMKDGAVSKLGALKDYGTGRFKSGWAKMQGVLGGPADAAKKKFSDLFGAGGTVRRIFSGLVTAAKSIFGKLKDVVAGPVNAMIDKINTGLIRDGINFLLKKVVPKDQQKKVLLPWIPHMATGGRVRGPGTPTSDDVPIMGSRDEYMVKAKSAKKIGYDNLEYLNKTGQIPVPHLATGGRLVRPVQGSLSQGIHDAYTGFPAVDFGIPTGTPVVAGNSGKVVVSKDIFGNQNGGYASYGRYIEVAGDGITTLYAHLSKRIAQMGANVSAGQQIGISGNTGHSTGDHLHFGAKGISPMAFLGQAYANTGQASGGSAIGALWNKIKDTAGKIIGDPAKWIGDKVNGIKSGIANFAGGSPLLTGLSYMPAALMAGAKDWVLGKLGGGGDGTSATWNGASVGGLTQEQLNTAATIISTARGQGFGDRGATIGVMTAMQESRLRNLNYGDADSLGSFQQRGPWGPASDRMNVAKAASMFFNGGQGGQPGLRSKDWRNMGLGQAAQAVQVSNFPGAYTQWEGLARQLVGKFANGGTTPRSGVSLLGENGPEFVKLPGASTVANNRRTNALLGREKITEFRITDWEKGIGYFRSVAQEEIDQADEFAGTMSNMRGR